MGVKGEGGRGEGGGSEGAVMRAHARVDAHKARAIASILCMLFVSVKYLS